MTNGNKSCIIVTGNLPLQGSRHSAIDRRENLPWNSARSFTHQMRRNFSKPHSYIGLLITLCTFAANISAQAPMEVGESSGTGWLLILLIAAAGLGGGYYFWSKSKKGINESQYKYENRSTEYYNNASYEMDGVDAEKELEWLRKAKKSTAKTGGQKMAANSKKNGAGKGGFASAGKPKNIEDFEFDTKAFQEKMRKLQYAHLPINSFSELKQSKMYTPLPISDDPSVLNAIEQANEEFEEDESVRELAVKILTAFRTRNSIEALSQIALYDLSSNLRSKAVAILTDFDHESVFEAILLACADPTREVRAAAARGLFRLNFDRADAWKRIIETNDEFRMSHAARAAIESGIVVKSFDRLVHEDLKVAYESFVLISLIIKSGETAQVFEAIKDHKDDRIKFALLHAIKVLKDERSITALSEFRKNGSFSPDVADRIRDTINIYEQEMAWRVS